MANAFQSFGQAIPAIAQYEDIGNAKQRLAYMGQELRSNLANDEQRRAIGAIQLENMRQRQEEENADIDMTTNPVFRELSPRTQAETLKYFQGIGAVNERGIGKRGRVNRGWFQLQGEKDAMQPLIDTEINESNQAMTKAWEALKKVNSLPVEDQDYEKSQKLQGEYNAAKDRYDKMLGLSQTYREKILPKIAEKNENRRLIDNLIKENPNLVNQLSTEDRFQLLRARDSGDWAAFNQIKENAIGRTPLEKLITARDSLPQDSPLRPDFQRAIDKLEGVGANKTIDQRAVAVARARLQAKGVDREPTDQEVLDVIKEYNQQNAQGQAYGREKGKMIADYETSVPKTDADRKEWIALYAQNPQQWGYMLGRHPALILPTIQGLSDWEKDKGLPPGGAMQVAATYNAAKQNLARQMKVAGDIDRFETKFNLNVDNALQMSNQFPRGSYPSINKLVQGIQRETGNPDIDAFVNQTVIAATEAMKIINAGSGITAAELTVSGQRKAEEILRASDNPKAYAAKVNALKTDVQHARVGTGKAVQDMMDVLKDLPEKPQTYTPGAYKPVEVQVGRFKLKTEVPADWNGYGVVTKKGAVVNPNQSKTQKQQVIDIIKSERANGTSVDQLKKDLKAKGIDSKPYEEYLK